MAIAVLVLDSCYHLTLFLHSQFCWISSHSPYVLDVSSLYSSLLFKSVVLLDNFWYYRLFQSFFLWFNL
jgi:hypothetical protein